MISHGTFSLTEGCLCLHVTEAQKHKTASQEGLLVIHATTHKKEDLLEFKSALSTLEFNIRTKVIAFNST